MSTWNQNKRLEPLRFTSVLLLLATWLATAAQAGDVLDGVKTRGELRCGASLEILV